MELKKYIYHIQCDICGLSSGVCIYDSKVDIPDPRANICGTCLAALNEVVHASEKPEQGNNQKEQS